MPFKDTERRKEYNKLLKRRRRAEKKEAIPLALPSPAETERQESLKRAAIVGSYFWG